MTDVRKFGPATDWNALGALVAGAHPLWLLPADEVLVYHDGPIYYYGQIAGDESVYLRVQVDQDHGGGEGAALYPRTIEITSHYLAFPSIEALTETLHDDQHPTIETYEKATSILREVTRHSLIAAGEATDCEVEIADISFADICEDELPYRYLRSGGNIMEFSGDTVDGLTAACGTTYVWPLPNLHTLVYFDYPRSWIGETRSGNKPSVHLHTMVDEKHGWELCYRLTFQDEATLRATLYQGYVATRESFRQATKIVREELSVSSDPEHWILRVQEMSLDQVPEHELPAAKTKPSPAPESPKS